MLLTQTIQKYPMVSILFAVLFIAVSILSLQLPFMYYSDDVLFHSAKIMAAKDGDFFTDPITGWESIYPPLFHIINGKIADIFSLSSFQTSRMLQVVQFLGCFLAAFFLFTIAIGLKEQAAFATLCLVLLFYAPTGKYWLLHNPYNYSLMFVITGAALLLWYAETSQLRFGISGAVFLGIGVDIWWFNVAPASGLAVGTLLKFISEHRLRSETKSLSLIALTFILVLSYNFWVFLQIRNSLPYYFDMFNTDHSKYNVSKALYDSISTFLLKGNQQFFGYLLPSALQSTNKIVLVYGYAATVYFYFIVLPFNYLLLYHSVKSTFTSYREKRFGHHQILLVAASITLLMSFLLYRPGSNVAYVDLAFVRRIQFYCFLFLFPAFVHVLFTKYEIGKKKKIKWVLVGSCSLMLLSSVVYRNEATINSPVSYGTKQLINYIRMIPNHANRRFFVSEYDNHRLSREIRFRSFLLKGNPIYFRVDKHHGDSIKMAYDGIIRQDINSEKLLREFNTEYAIVGKSSINISPVIGKKNENILSTRLLSYFRKNADTVFENKEWVIFKLAYPFESRTYHQGVTE
jgi:hypothetical protein